MHFWKHIQQALIQDKQVALLYVLDSKGSSPGRQGFYMLVSESGEMRGSIGGGIMEHKLVELAKTKLNQNDKEPIVKRQVHTKSEANNQSGMICSGEQSIAIFILTENDMPAIDNIHSCLLKGHSGTLELSPSGLQFSDAHTEINYTYQYQDERSWSYQEKIGFKKKAFIIGGGHVSNALSRVLVDLEFHCTVIDDREDLNTLIENKSAQQKKVLSYAQLNDSILEGDDVFIFIMTFGYRSDLDVLQQVIDKDVAFKGMMGSAEKVKQLMGEMRGLGYSEHQLNTIHSPIGLPIKSRTPQEIAISIAAQIIQFTNKDLP